MNKLELMTWLGSLAAGCQATPTANTIEAYLEILIEWRLDLKQWTELRKRALSRHRIVKFLPTISDLHEIYIEILKEAELRRNTARVQAMMRPQPEPEPKPAA
jgi:hypothetical protein